MVSTAAAAAAAAAAVHGHKLSTVSTSTVTGEDVVHDLAGVDLAMKLHYLRFVYYFGRSEAVEGLTALALKQPMFPMLDVNYPLAGRVRRSEAGRPHVKCNDSGVRIVEASCDDTVEEWLRKAEEAPQRYKQLAYDKVLGPDLHFSPLLYVQFTRFKCGGLAVGFSWAHVIGDAVSASNCINQWGRFLNQALGDAVSASNCISQWARYYEKCPPPPKNLRLPNSRDKTGKRAKSSPGATKPRSVKEVESVGDFWLAPNSQRMATFSMQFTETMLKQLQSKFSSHVPPFEAISAFIWQSLARLRAEKEPKLVTVLRNATSEKRSGNLCNEPAITTAASHASPAKIKLSELAMMLMTKEAQDEKMAIEEMVDTETGKPDLVVYGANLTFVDMEGVDLYGLEVKGQKPVHVDHYIDGVADEGAVLVFPSTAGAADGNSNRTVTLILPENQVSHLKEMLESELGSA